MFFAPASERIGSIKGWGGAAVPAGWLDCNGAAVSRSTYSALFAEIGTAYGAGDGATTFNLPDLRGRALLGAGTGSGLTARARGATGGAETHPLTGAETGPHTHGPGDGASNFVVQQSGVGPNDYPGGAQLRPAAATASGGGGSAHNNMQPFGVAFYIIKAER